MKLLYESRRGPSTLHNQKGNNRTTKPELTARQKARLTNPSDIEAHSVKEITGALNALLADVFSLYLRHRLPECFSQ